MESWSNESHGVMLVSQLNLLLFVISMFTFALKREFLKAKQGQPQRDIMNIWIHNFGRGLLVYSNALTPFKGKHYRLPLFKWQKMPLQLVSYNMKCLGFKWKSAIVSHPFFSHIFFFNLFPNLLNHLLQSLHRKKWLSPTN